jgi:transcriptional regulator of acetoin/glycerol metabolism
VAIHHRGDDANAGEFKHWGIWVGVWSEETEGTNGIGTCIAEQRPVLVHGDQHFRTRHTRLSCAGAPVFDPQGELVAVLDVSRVASLEDQGLLPLVLDMVTAAARAIEERLFREHFRHAWTIAALPSDNEPALLVAVDEHQWMLGVDRIARDVLGLDGDKLGAVFSCRRLSSSTVRFFDRLARGTSRLGSCGPAAEHGGMHCLRRRLANPE